MLTLKMLGVAEILKSKPLTYTIDDNYPCALPFSCFQMKRMCDYTKPQSLPTKLLEL